MNAVVNNQDKKLDIHQVLTWLDSQNLAFWDPRSECYVDFHRKGRKGVRDQIEGFGGNCAAAAIVGRAIAEKTKALGISQARFDRNGYKFHGRVKALVEAAREAGLKL